MINRNNGLMLGSGLWLWLDLVFK